MKFLVAVASLAALAVAAPSAIENLEARLVPAASATEKLAPRQVFPHCGYGVQPGEYRCYANISDPNNPFEYIGLCGTDGKNYVSAKYWFLT